MTEPTTSNQFNAAQTPRGATGSPVAHTAAPTDAAAGTSAPQHATRDASRYLVPPVDIFEGPDGLTVVADLPGVARDNVSVRVEKGVLTIQGRTAHDGESHDRSEYTLLDYFRQFELSEVFDQEKISAELRQGVLTVRLPKLAAAQPRNVEVKVA